MLAPRGGPNEQLTGGMDQEVAYVAENPKDVNMTKPMTGAAQANILLVDDRPDKILALETILSPLGQRILKANSGEEALRILLNEEAAVIVLDVMMPGMDGFETAKLIRERESTGDIPIIFVSALDATNERVNRAYALGAVDYVPGPSSPDALRAKVRVFVELHHKTQALKNKSDQMEEFCYAVAHDLRAPLRTIDGFCQRLLDTTGGKLDENEKEYLTRICASVARMTTLTRDLLDYAKIQTADVTNQPVDLTEVARAAVEFYGEEIKNACAKVVLRGPLGRVLASEDGLIRVLRNLVGNALHYAEDGRNPEVELSSQLNADKIRLSVRDNGIGIPPDQINKLFRMFERISKRREGSGLGLAMVKSGIERMGGQVGVESRLGEGSTFWVELPSAEK